jgi:putative membrane protein
LQFHFQQAVRALILLAFTGLIFKMHFTGDITKFINPKYVGLSQTASVIFLVLFFIQITRVWTDKPRGHQHCDHDHEGPECSHHHDHGDTPFTMRKLVSYSIIVFPLLTGFLLPPKVLDASIAEKKGGMAIIASPKQQNGKATQNSPSGSVQNNELAEDESGGDIAENSTGDHSFIDENAVPDIQNMMSKKEYEEIIQKLENSSPIVMDDLVFSSYYEEISADIEKFKGRQIELTGFVYKEDVLAQNQLVLSRFLITHCVADASIIGFISELQEAPQIDQDTWIKASGVIDITSYEGVELPMIKINSWEKVEEPLEPYLYPIMVKIL